MGNQILNTKDNDGKLVPKDKNKKTYCLHCNKELVKRQKKFCSSKCQTEYLYKQYIQEWKANKKDGIRGTYQTSNHIIRYIREKYNNKCGKCG